MRAKKDTYALRTYYSPQKTWRVEDFDLRMRFTSEHSEEPYMGRNLNLSYNILAGSRLYGCNEQEVAYCDIYKSGGKR